MEHLIPGPNFHPDLLAPQFMHNAQILFFLYFCMTGMHAVHMIVGVGLLTYLLIQAYRRQFNANYFCTRGNDWLVLALCRHRLDFPVPITLFDWTLALVKL